MSQETKNKVSRRSMFKGLPLAAVAADLPKMAESAEPACASEYPPEFDFARMSAAMERLRAKAAVLNIGDFVNLCPGGAEFPDAPKAGMHRVSAIDETFIQVDGVEQWVPVERVSGRFEFIEDPN